MGVDSLLMFGQLDTGSLVGAAREGPPLLSQYLPNRQ